MSNAVDFISAYNLVDARLRSIYRGKGNLQFSDLVRRCAEADSVVRRYEEDLLAYARLRNAIVHESTKEGVIAEPNDEVTARFRHIADLLTSPPKLSALKERGATGIDAEKSLADAVRTISKSGYSNLPVYRNGLMIGMLNNRRIVRAIGLVLERGEDLSALLSAPCSSVLRDEDLLDFYKILGKNDTVQEAVDAFSQNRKLLAVIVTERGGLRDRIVNIFTASDLPRLLKLLEE